MLHYENNNYSTSMELSRSAKEEREIITTDDLLFRFLLFSINNFYDLFCSSISNRFFQGKKNILIFTLFCSSWNKLLVYIYLCIQMKMGNGIDWLFACIGFRTHQYKKEIDGGSTFTSQSVPLSDQRSTG